MTVIKATAPAPRPVFVAPGHVNALRLLAILTMFGGIVIIALGEVIPGLVSLFQAIALLIFHAVAEDAAYSRWRIDRLAAELAVVINESAAQASDRESVYRQKEREQRELQLEQQRRISGDE